MTALSAFMYNAEREGADHYSVPGDVTIKNGFVAIVGSYIKMKSVWMNF